MNRHTKIWLGTGALTVVFLFAGVRMQALKPKTLQDFEQRCMKTTDPLKRQKIALEAMDFLVQQGVPDTIVAEIQEAVLMEKVSVVPESAWAETSGVAMNDSLWALYENRLAKFLPIIFYLKQSTDPATLQTQLKPAQKIAEKLDSYVEYNYWSPLLNFLAEADSSTWHHWRTAVIAAKKSKEAYNVSKYDRAKWLATEGLQNLSKIPYDRRLYLELCFRLQNAIAEGESTFRLMFAFGDWITQECLAVRYYLRAVSMEYNVANQLYRPGRYDEMIEKLKNVQYLTKRWRVFHEMEWYGRRALERLAAALYELGEFQTASQYLEEFGKVTEGNTEAALYHIDKGQIAEAYGNYEDAERQYSASIIAAKGNLDDSDDDDAHNVWEGYDYLVSLFLKYNLPDKAMKYYREADEYIKSRADFLKNNERAGYSFIRLAEIQIKSEQLDNARVALRQVEKRLHLIDSPQLLVERLAKTAVLYQSLKEYEKARNRIEQALTISRRNGLFSEEIKLVLQKSEFALQTPSEDVKPHFPLNELSQIIHQFSDNNDRSQLIRARVLLLDAAYKAGRLDLAKHQANLLFLQIETLSQQYAREERLIFFQHSIYKNIKVAIQLDIMLGQLDSAFVKLSFVKGRALRGRIVESKEKPFDPGEAQQSLQDSEVVLDYMVTTDTLYVFMLTRSALQLVRIPANKQQLQTKVEAYVNYLKNDNLFDQSNSERYFAKIFGETVQQSNDLYHALFDSIAPRLRGLTRIYVIPDEFLYALPFSTLALQANFNTRFLAEDKAIMVLPGAWLLRTETDPRATTQQRTELLVSMDPNMPGAGELKKYLKTRPEYLADIYTQWQNKTTIKSQLARRYCHYLFYAHAIANWDEPRHSWIEFPLSPPDHAGRLSYDDIDSLDWRQADLVILAGCETSGSRLYLGSGLTGLQRGFLAAGARQVLATYWKVIARLTAEQLQYFLNAWDQQHDALFALQAMQKTAIERLRSDPVFKYAHPQLWGAYNLAGTKPNVRQTINWSAN